MDARLSFRSLVEWVAIAALFAAIVAESSRERFVLSLIAPIPIALGFRWLSHPTALHVCRGLAVMVVATGTAFVVMFAATLAQVGSSGGTGMLWVLGGFLLAFALALWLSVGAAIGYTQYHEWWDERRQRAQRSGKNPATKEYDGRLDASGL